MKDEGCMRHSMKMLLLFIVAMFGFFPLRGEIQLVTLNWKTGVCKSECIRHLEKQLRAIPLISEIQINEGAGQAQLKLKPNSSFTYEPFRMAMESIGISITHLDLVVRGQISSQGQDYVLLSTGDNTAFTLINPIVPERDNYIVQYNTVPGNKKLTPNLIKQLEEGRKAKELATIQGQLLFPENSPPLLLIIQHIKFGPPESQTKIPRSG